MGWALCHHLGNPCRHCVFTLSDGLFIFKTVSTKGKEIQMKSPPYLITTTHLSGFPKITNAKSPLYSSRKKKFYLIICPHIIMIAFNKFINP